MLWAPRPCGNERQCRWTRHSAARRAHHVRSRGGGGIVLKHKGEGDSTFSVFASASAAVAAATDAQRQLASEVWPDADADRRTDGPPQRRGGPTRADYYGQTVNRAARVRALAEGGQVLLSSVSASLVGAHLPDETELRFLRSELLRGIDRLEAIHELVDARRQVAPPSLAQSGADARSSTTDRLGVAHGLRRPRGPPSTHRGGAADGHSRASCKRCCSGESPGLGSRRSQR